ncbi:sensor histidine kinase [Fibrella aquatica]|uniref:sensor histidine kinase n=1 Tax=Fibrella aquatica TaxID=3242487 RepID=UPI00351FAFDC
MKQFFSPKLGVMLLLLTAALASRAQVATTDSMGVRRSETAQKEIFRLKTTLSGTVNLLSLSDSVLTISRQQPSVPKQIIALCQLASRELQEQPQKAAARLQEANRLAAQLRDLREAGWVIGQVARIQAGVMRSSPSQATAFSPILETLGRSMGASVVVGGRSRGNAPFVFESNPFSDKRVYDRRSQPERPAEPAPPLLPEIDPTQLRRIRVRPDFVDRLLDTLILFDKSSPQVVQQLTARKKLRDSNQALSTAFAKEGDYAQAYRYFLQYTAYKDSLTAEATSRRLASLRYKQNLLKKESQIQLLTKDRQLREQESNRQRQYVLLLIGCIALLAGVAFVLIRNNRAKQLANQQLSEQKEALQETLAQLKTTQTQLIQAEKMASLGELTAGIAHEIQNPLNFVNNFSEVSAELVTELIENRQLAERDDELENDLLSDLNQNLGKIIEHGNRASSIIKGMLEHARTTGGQKEPTDLNALVDEYAKLAFHSLQAKDKSVMAQLITELHPTLSRVMVSQQEVGRVILNIINNAFYAVQKRQQRGEADYQPTVVVSTYEEANQVCVSIRDNGTGMPETVKAKIFQPFFTTKPAGQGTGLGLSISYDIITKGHGGMLLINSEEGQFSEFTIKLPIVG